MSSVLQKKIREKYQFLIINYVMLTEIRHKKKYCLLVCKDVSFSEILKEE